MNRITTNKGIKAIGIERRTEQIKLMSKNVSYTMVSTGKIL